MPPGCPVCGEEIAYAETAIEDGSPAGGWRTVQPGDTTYAPCGCVKRRGRAVPMGRESSMTNYLGREAILEAADQVYDEVECPEWGGTVRLRSITGAQRDAYEGSIVSMKGSDRQVNLRNARSKLILLCAVDGDGRPLFTQEDLGALARKNAKPIDRLFDACRKLTGMSEDDVKQLTEDFGAARSDEGTSDSL